MSDARTTPPSFDEMVGLIKTLFSDYLEDIMKSSPEEIEKSWLRYKTLNHLYQDEALHPSESAGVNPFQHSEGGPSETALTNGDVAIGAKGALWVKAQLEGLQGYIAGLADRTEDAFEKNVYNHRIGYLYTALSVIEKYKDYFDESPSLSPDQSGKEDAVAFAEWIKNEQWNQRSGIDWARY